MTVWREEDHPRDEGGRFVFKGATSAISIRRTLAHVESADDGALLDVFVRVFARKRRGKSDEEALARIDRELERRAAGGEPEPTPEQRRVEQLVAAGSTWDEAYREAYGREGDDQGADVDRRSGESREQMRRRHYAEKTYLVMLQAESWTRGNMLNKAGRAAGINPASLFSGPRARAYKYASEELQRYWAEQEPRRTYAEYRAEQIGDTGGARRARSARVQAGSGKDHQ